MCEHGAENRALVIRRDAADYDAVRAGGGGPVEDLTVGEDRELKIRFLCCGEEFEVFVV
jgi:hypothetical protein